MLAQDGIKKTHGKKRRNKKKEKGRGHHKRNKNCKYDEKVRERGVKANNTPLPPFTSPVIRRFANSSRVILV